MELGRKFQIVILVIVFVQVCCKTLEEHKKIKQAWEKQVFRFKKEINEMVQNNNESAETLEVQYNKTEQELKSEIDKLNEEVLRLKKENNETVEHNNASPMFKNLLNQLKTLETQKPPKNCKKASKGEIGVFVIKIPNSDLAPFVVYCDSDNWMVILRRVDETVNFQRKWSDYKDGFGDLTGNFIMGLQKIHKVTNGDAHELKIVLEDFNKNSTFALYDQFAIDDESNGFALKTLGKHSGTVRDALRYHKGMKFTTIDKDNDKRKHGNCAKKHNGGWWYNSCTECKLTGDYLTHEVSDYDGIMWDDGKRQYYSYKFAEMKIRPIITSNRPSFGLRGHGTASISILLLVITIIF